MLICSLHVCKNVMHQKKEIRGGRFDVMKRNCGFFFLKMGWEGRGGASSRSLHPSHISPFILKRSPNSSPVYVGRGREMGEGGVGAMKLIRFKFSAGDFFFLSSVCLLATAHGHGDCAVTQAGATHTHARARPRTHTHTLQAKQHRRQL